MCHSLCVLRELGYIQSFCCVIAKVVFKNTYTAAMNVPACLLCLLFVGFLKNDARAQEGEVTCPSRTIMAKMNECHTMVRLCLSKTYNPECIEGGINTCLCRDLEDAFYCYITLWDACAEDPALSGLGWDYDHFINYMFLNTIGDRCPAGTFITTTTTASPTTTGSP